MGMFRDAKTHDFIIKIFIQKGLGRTSNLLTSVSGMALIS